MSSKDEALKMAIEALQNNQTYDWKGNPLTALDEANEKVINVCKEVLESQEQYADFVFICKHCGDKLGIKWSEDAVDEMTINHKETGVKDGYTE